MLDTGGHTGRINGLAWTPDGKRLISAGHDKIIRSWELEFPTASHMEATVQRLPSIRGDLGEGLHGAIFAMAVSPDGRRLAAGGWTSAECPGRCGDIRLIDLKTGKLERMLIGHHDVVNSVVFSPDGRLLISGSGLGDRSAIIWDVAEGKILQRLGGHKSLILGLGFSPDGQRVVTGSDDATLRLWRITNGALIAEMNGHRKPIRRALAVRRTDGLIASGNSSGEIRLWDGTTGAFVRVLANQGGVIGALAFSPDGTRLVSTCGLNCRGTPAARAFGTRPPAKRSQPIEAMIASLTGSHSDPDGRLIATGGGFNHEIHVWDPRTGTRVSEGGPDSGRPLTLTGSGAPVWAVGMSADGMRVGWGNTWSQGSPLSEAPFSIAFVCRWARGRSANPLHSRPIPRTLRGTVNPASIRPHWIRPARGDVPSPVMVP